MDTTAELSDSTLVVEETPPTPALRRPTTSPPPTPLPNRGSSLKDSILLVSDDEDSKDDKDELQLEAPREQVDARVMGAGAAAAGAGATEAGEPSLTPQPSSSYASDFDLPKFEQSARAGPSPPPDHEREASASPPASGAAYREHEHVSSNTTRASPGDDPSSDQDDAFPTPPAGQAAPPSTPPRSSTTTTHEPSSASTQASQARQQLAQPTSSFRGPPTQLDDSPDPMRLIAVPSSRPSAKSSGRARSRSRSVSIPPMARTKGKGKSKSVSSHRGGHSSDGPSSSAPPALEMRSSHLDAPSSSASTVTGPSSTFPLKPVVERQPLATRMPSPEPTIIEESPAEEEAVETSRPAQALAAKAEARFYVEVPPKNQKRLSLSRTGANENELATPTSTSSGRKSSSRPSSAPPAGAPPAHTSSQISRDDEKMSADGASPKSASPPRRTFAFSVVVPPARRASAGNQALPPPVSKAADDAIAAPSPPRPSQRASSELSSPPSSSPPSLPAPEKRVRSAASSSEHSASEAEAGPSQSPAKKRRPAPPKSSKAEKAAPASNDKDAEGSGDDAHPTRVAAGKRPRRAAVKKTTLKESSDSGESGDGSGNGSSSAEEVQKKKKPKRAPSVRKPVASTSGSKGKKVVEKEVKPSQVKAPKLPPSSMPTSTQATAEGLLSLAKLNPAPKETPEQRSESWVLARMDGVSWTLVVHGTTKFWWPAEIVSKPRSTRPLALTLIADPSNDIIKINPTRQVLLADPSSSNILSFRSSCKGRPIRFDGANFVESAGGVDSDAPSPEAFEGALGNALLRQNSLDFSDDESDDEAPPPAARKPKASASKAKAVDLDVSSDKDEDEAPAAVESDEELTKGADDNKFTTFPFRCIALNSRAWWPALCTSYSEAGTLDAKGKPLKSAQYNLKWSDGSIGAVPRKKLALPSEKRFFTVPLGDTTLDVPKDYSEDLVAFVKSEVNVWDSIIKNDFGPAKLWNDEFMAGGSRRQLLTKWARFGELEDGHRDALSDALKAWALPSDGNRPIGSPQYEALPEASRSLYIVDVLLSIAVILVNVEERSHEKKAKAILIAERKPNAPDPTPDEIMARAFIIAQQELQEGSLSKWVVSVRMNRKMAEGGKKGKGKG